MGVTHAELGRNYPDNIGKYNTFYNLRLKTKL